MQQPVARPVAPPSRPQPPAGSEISAFAAAARQAVQSALIFPPAAQMANDQGTVEVQFTYRDGMVADVRVIRSSGSPLLDAAARQTVEHANYPRPPANLRGHAMTINVDVVYRL